jgi:hypothetical protein
MENNINSLPDCIRHDCCHCFSVLFLKPPNYDPTDILQYTTYNYGELTKYLEEINKHLKKDVIFNRRDHIDVPAVEVKRANDHLIATLNRLLLFSSRNKFKGQFCFNYYHNKLNCEELTDLFLSIAHTQDKSIQLLNRPLSLIDIKYLADVLEQHRISLYVLHQFFNVINYGQVIYSANFTNIENLPVKNFYLNI